MLLSLNTNSLLLSSNTSQSCTAFLSSKRKASLCPWNHKAARVVHRVGELSFSTAYPRLCPCCSRDRHHSQTTGRREHQGLTGFQGFWTRWFLSRSFLTVKFHHSGGNTKKWENRGTCEKGSLKGSSAGFSTEPSLCHHPPPNQVCSPFPLNPGPDVTLGYEGYESKGLGNW